MTRLYGTMIRPGDLCFDIGAHVGNRVRVWTRLGARVVAVEPQPVCVWFLRRWIARDPQVELVEGAIGARPGVETLLVSARTPTVTTLSPSWIEAVRTVDSFARVAWEERVDVPVLTLDMLIERYGMPAFCKIDVEGYELAVLQGLSHPPATLSFEYIPAAMEMARDCIEQLATLGTYRYNWSVGEQHRFQSPQPLAGADLLARLAQLPPDANSGDIYAFRQP